MAVPVQGEPAAPLAAGTQVLACMNCGEQRSFQLDSRQLHELLSQQQVRLVCAHCQMPTTWTGVEPDRRSSPPRRAAQRVRMELPVRVRSDSPQLSFVEVTRTLNASREGACFLLHQPVREGMEVQVLMPYQEGDNLPETRAKVVRAEKFGDVWQVGVEFIRKQAY